MTPAGYRDLNPCLCCGLRSAAFQVAGAMDCLDDDQAAAVAEAAPQLFEACQAMTQEVQRDEHDAPGEPDQVRPEAPR